jgi:hypothetical protein
LKLPKRGNKIQKASAAQSVDWAEAHLFDRRSVVEEQEIWRYALERARGSSLSVEAIKAETTARPYIREANRKLTRRDVLARELQIVCLAKDGVARFAPLTDPSHRRADDLASTSTAHSPRSLSHAISWRSFGVALAQGRATSYGVSNLP